MRQTRWLILLVVLLVSSFCVPLVLAARSLDATTNGTQKLLTSNTTTNISQRV